MADQSTPGVDLGIPGIEDAVQIGRGGFGVVYRALQPEFGRTVAVKVLTPGALDEATRSRFRRELKAVGMLSGHPNIVTVYSAGFSAIGDPYLIMGYEEGGSLGDTLRVSGPMPWREALTIGIRIGGALEAAHARGILHRDIKPENILVSSFGEPKLADFGIARMQGGTATKTGLLIATIAHAAPELLAGTTPSVASDVYALGSTIYTLIKGTPAFAAVDDEGPLPMMMRIGSESVPDLRAVGIPDEVCRVLEQAMAKAPGDRQPTAAEFGSQQTAAMSRSALAPIAAVTINERGTSATATVPEDLVTSHGTGVNAAEPAALLSTSDTTADAHTDPENVTETILSAKQFPLSRAGGEDQDNERHGATTLRPTTSTPRSASLRSAIRHRDSASLREINSALDPRDSRRFEREGRDHQFVVVTEQCVALARGWHGEVEIAVLPFSDIRRVEVSSGLKTGRLTIVAVPERSATSLSACPSPYASIEFPSADSESFEKVKSFIVDKISADPLRATPELDAIRAELETGETILLSAEGRYGQAVALTGRRVLVGTPSTVGLAVHTMAYSEIDDVDVSSGLLSGRMTITPTLTPRRFGRGRDIPSISFDVADLPRFQRIAAQMLGRAGLAGHEGAGEPLPYIIGTGMPPSGVDE